MNDAVISKLVNVCGHPLTICGVSSDPYFEHIESHMPGNAFFGAVLAHHVSPGATIIDVGANIGVTTSLASAMVPASSIVAIEPSATAFRCLTATIAANEARAELVRACIGASDGWSAFFEMPFLAGSHRVAADHPTIHNAPSSTAMLSLDSLVARKQLSRVDLVKIDVEGFESDVLLGMKDTISKHQPLVFMEFNCFTLTAYGNISPRALLDQIRATFGIVYYEQGGALIRAESDADFLGLLHLTMTARGCVSDILFTSSEQRRAALGV